MPRTPCLRSCVAAALTIFCCVSLNSAWDVRGIAFDAPVVSRAGGDFREVRRPLLDEGAHGFLVLGGAGGADHILRLVIERGEEIRRDRRVEVVLDGGKRSARALRQ